MPADDLAKDRPERSSEELLALIREHGAGVIRDHWVVRVPTNQPPWTSTGVNLKAGDGISLFCFDGRGRKRILRHGWEPILG
jgi:hypothetical protein